MLNPSDRFKRLTVSLKYEEEEQFQALRAIFATETGERISLSKAIRMSVSESLKSRAL